MADDSDTSSDEYTKYTNNDSEYSSDDTDYEDQTPCPQNPFSFGNPAPAPTLPRRVCECKRCYQVRNSKSRPGPEDVIAAYYERNHDYCARREHRKQESTWRNRHVVLTHRGFQVSFPEPMEPQPSSRQYRHAHPDEEVAENDEKMRQLVAQGMWSDEIQKHYTNLIDDFKYGEVRSQLETAPSTAFPRHEMLVAASFTSSIAILESHLWCAPLACVRIISLAIPLQCADPAAFVSKSKSKAMALAPASSVFTETTEPQRAKLLAYSGIAGKLAARLFGRCGPVNCGSGNGCNGNNNRTFQKSAFVLMQRVHSLQTCEILTDNRYWFDGSFHRPLKEIDQATPIRELIAEFRELYHGCIADLKCVAVKYKRGFIGVDEIHSDQIFGRFYSLLILCIKRLMNLRNKSENLDEPEETTMKRTNRIMKFVAEFPDVYHADVARVFGLSAMKLRISTRGTQLRLASQGCYSAFLSFAVSEPRMVDAFLAPEIGNRYGGIMDGSDCENHISSRHRVFGGELLKKYRHHIPRTAEVLADMCRNNL